MKNIHEYTEDELINDLYRFFKENNRIPKSNDMRVKNGYIDINIYYKIFGSWKNALMKTSFYNPNYYTKDQLIEYLCDYVEKHGKIPSSKDVGGEYPSMCTYKKAFGSWNNALKAANLTLHIEHDVIYTEEELIKSINDFIVQNKRSPKECEMCQKNGYIPANRYIQYYGSWINASKQIGFDTTAPRYTKNELIDVIHKFVQKYNRLPITKDFRNNPEYPSWDVYRRHFGSWNNALKSAGYEPQYTYHKHSDIKEYCSICGCLIKNKWRYNENDDLKCDKCCQSDRKFLKGILDPNCTAAMGTITEHVVYKVLEDCVKCNNRDSFTNKYDLISDKYGSINVKSVRLSTGRRSLYWKYDTEDKVKPNYYICLGLNKNRSRILHVWIIPSNSNLVAKTCITITNSENALKRAEQYEVDPKPYNEVYQNLDITTLPEFRNINQNDTSIAGDAIEI